MLTDDIKKIKIGEKDLRSFGRLVGGILLLIASFSFWRGRPHWFWFAAAGLPLIILGQAAPMKLKLIYRVWMTLALCMGWVMTRVLLTVVFFAVMTPLAWCARLSGKRFLNLGFRENQSSYWVRRVRTESVKAQLEKQF